MHNLNDDDLNQFEQALATLSGVAPRGWAVVDSSLAYVGNVQSSGVVGNGLHVSVSSHHPENVAAALAVSIILNDAGRLLMELRRARDAYRIAD